MIEKCGYCNKEHETGEDWKVGGIPIKQCPDVPDEIVAFCPPAKPRTDFWAGILGSGAAGTVGQGVGGILGWSSDDEWPDVIE